MEIEKAIEILENHNKWRRNIDDSLDLKQANPTDLGIAIETVVKKFKPIIDCECQKGIASIIGIDGGCKDFYVGNNLIK